MLEEYVQFLIGAIQCFINEEEDPYIVSSMILSLGR